jgi:SRSO17 transposase
VQFLNTNPALLLINKDNYQKKVFENKEQEITEAIQILQSLDFPNAAKILASQLP